MRGSGPWGALRGCGLRAREASDKPADPQPPRYLTRYFANVSFSFSILIGLDR